MDSMSDLKALPVTSSGNGATQMAAAGFSEGWGTGRHVLGSNYFHYVRDPWGSYSEYSCDMDFVPGGFDWPTADHPPEDSFYAWGPKVPEDFVTNFEVEAQAEVQVEVQAEAKAAA